MTAPVLVTAFGLFIGTNIDDILILTLLFLAFNAKGRPRRRDIVLGQYAGIGALVAISLIAAFGLTLVPELWVGLFGLVPLALGVVGLVKAIRGGGEQSKRLPITAPGIIGVTGLTIANGADNITVYTPVFHDLDMAGITTTITVFAVLTAVWCFVAAKLGKHRLLVTTVERFGHWIVPLVFIVVGIAILIRVGLFTAM